MQAKFSPLEFHLNWKLDLKLDSAFFFHPTPATVIIHQQYVCLAHLDGFKESNTLFSWSISYLIIARFEHTLKVVFTLGVRDSTSVESP
jgi:hypothetical protein